MNAITFPGLNLSFNVNQKILIGNFEIYYYAICIVSGIIISLILASKSKEKFGVEFEELLEIMIYSLISGIIGARLYYVIFKFDYYKNSLIKIFNIRDGGLAIYGGIICGAITAYLVCKKKKINVLDFFDYIAPYVAFSQGVGRIGNFFNIEAFGLETNTFLRMGIYIEKIYKEVHPCFLYEFISCMLIFIILKIMQKNRKYKSQILSFYLFFYGIVRLFIEGLRTDSLMFFNMKISQIVSILFIIAGVTLCLQKKKKTIHTNNVSKNGKYCR